MPDLARFLAFAGRTAAVAPVAPAPKAGATSSSQVKRQSNQLLVQRVAPVAPENNEGWDEADWQAAFDERAGILEYDEGLPRAEAEQLAREQVFGARTAAA